MIYSDTLNFKCGPESKNPILLNNCGPLAIPPDKASDIGWSLRETWPGLKKSTWANFESKNAVSIQLADKFVTPWKHTLVGSNIPDDPNDKEPYDCTFYLSRVGFSGEGAEAIVFVFFASYMDGVPSSGDYFLVRPSQSGKWEVQDRFQYFRTGGDDAKPASKVHKGD